MVSPLIALMQNQVDALCQLGIKLTAAQWISALRQLVTQGILESGIEACGSLKLTESARPILCGEQSLWLRRDLAQVKSKAGRHAKSAGPFAG